MCFTAPHCYAENLQGHRTSALILVLSGWSLFVSAIVRLRIHRDVPLPSNEPLSWLLTGTLQDVTVLGIAALCTLAIARWRPAIRVAEIGFTLFVIAITFLIIVRSEAVVFFGAVIRPEDLRGDVPITVAIRSLTGAPAILTALASVALVCALLIGRRIDPSRVAWLGMGALAGITVTSAMGAALLTRVVARASLAYNPIVSLMAIEEERMESPGARYAVRAPSVPVEAIRDFAGRSESRHYLDAAFPLARLSGSGDEPPSIRDDVKPNIVFIVMESLRAEEVGCYGADPPGVTPNLDALARDGIRVDPAFSAGTYTASAELAIWYGLPPIPKEVLITSRPSVAITGLPEILREAGWRTLLWIHSGDSNFYRRDSFYLPRGVQVIDGRSFPKSEPSTNWGYSDRALMRNAITALDRANQPFAAMLLTVTNHHPFALPSDADPPMPLPSIRSGTIGVRTSEMIQTVHYTDEAIGDFIRAARQRPWFAHTIFVVTGDHGSSIPPYHRAISTNDILLDLHNRVPLIIYSPLLPGGVVLRGPASHIDIMPTILRLIQFPATTGMGVDLFDRHAMAGRVMPVWNGHQRVLTLMSATRTYRATYSGLGQLDEQTPAEKLIDSARDLAGEHDLSRQEPETLARFHELARTYTSVYPWLVAHGRSGLPPAMLHPKATPVQHAKQSEAARKPA